MDVRDAEGVEAMAAKVSSDFGHIDFLVNNAAGTSSCRRNSSPRMAELGINIVRRNVETVQRGWEAMIEKKNGGVIST